MDARHRIGTIATAVAAVAFTGGRAFATAPPPPDTDLGRAAQACLDSGQGTPGNDVTGPSYSFFDNGLSVEVGGLATILHGDPKSCMLRSLGLPEWVAHISFVGVLKFGDWSVMKDLSETGDLLVMANEVAPETDHPRCLA